MAGLWEKHQHSDRPHPNGKSAPRPCDFCKKLRLASQGAAIRVAAPHPTMTGIITVAGITHEAIEPQALDDKGLRQVDLLIEWLTAR